MCFYSRQSKEALLAAKRFKAEVRDPEQFLTSDFINGFSHPSCPVITSDNPGLISNFTWGLIPQWSDKDSVSNYTLNARIETLNQINSFRDYVNNRCLVVADGFYEWRHERRAGRTFKDRYLITLPDNDLFAFAGLYSHWRDPATNILKGTFTILTTTASDIMSNIHNTKKRMPVILKKEDENSWLEGFPVNNFAYPYSIELSAFYSPDSNEKRGDPSSLLF